MLTRNDFGLIHISVFARRFARRGVNIGKFERYPAPAVARRHSIGVGRANGEGDAQILTLWNKSTTGARSGYSGDHEVIVFCYKMIVVQSAVPFRGAVLALAYLPWRQPAVHLARSAMETRVKNQSPPTRGLTRGYRGQHVLVGLPPHQAGAGPVCNKRVLNQAEAVTRKFCG